MTDAAGLTHAFLQQQPAKAADILEELSNSDVAAFLATAPARIVAPAVCYMANWKAAAVMEQLPPASAATLLASLDYDDRLSIARTIEQQKLDAILGELPAKTANQIKASMQYPEGTVGALMDPSAPALSQDTTAERALQYVRQNQTSGLTHLFIQDDDKKFAGAVAIAPLFAAPLQSQLSSLADKSVIPLSNRAALSAILPDPEWDDMPTRPVIGRNGTLTGGLSRSVVRHHLTKGAAGPSAAGSSVSMASHVLGMYVLTCQGLLGLLPQDSEGISTSHPSETNHDR